MSERFWAPVAFAASAALATAGCAGHETLQPQPSPAESVEALTPEEVAETEIQTYFGTMPHIRPEYTIFTDGYISKLRLNVMPENLQELSPKTLEVVQNAIVYIGGSVPGYKVSGSGFLLYSETLGRTELISAGHVASDMYEWSIDTRLNDGSVVDFDYIANYFNDPPDGAEDVFTTKEDLAIIQLKDSALYDGRALQGRDLAEQPLRVGEQLFLVNFQDKHVPGDPAVFTMVYGGQWGNESFGELIGDVMPTAEEDDLRGGGSGGVVVDIDGRVVGMSFSSINEPDYRNNECAKDIILDSVSLNGQDVYPYSFIPLSAGECDRGVSSGFMRTVAINGEFVPNSQVEGTVIVNLEE